VKTGGRTVTAGRWNYGGGPPTIFKGKGVRVGDKGQKVESGRKGGEKTNEKMARVQCGRGKGTLFV